MFREDKLLAYIKEYIDKHKEAPTQKEMMLEFGLAKGTISACLDRLAVRGEICREYDSSGHQIERALKLGSTERGVRAGMDNPFFDDPLLRKQVRTVVARYYSMKKYLKGIMEKDSLSRDKAPDGMPRGTELSDTTANIAVERADCVRTVGAQIEAIDKAIRTVDPQYRDAVWTYSTSKNVSAINASMGFYVSERSLMRYQSKFLYEVAKNLHYIC